MNNHYIQFAKNIFTQNGEDGIIEHLFKDLNIHDGVVVEFGAWDGVYLSNVYNLWKNKNFNAVLIESNVSKYADLQKISDKFDRVECVNACVSPNAEDQNSIDNILSRSSFDINDDSFALMSIDIDSCDYYIFESINKYFPKVIIIETNGGDLNKESKTHDNGCSLLSVDLLAKTKNYTLVCHTGNAIFIRNDLTHLIPPGDYSIQNLYQSDNNIMSLQSIGNDGLRTNQIYYLTEQYNNTISNEKNSI